MDNLKNWIDSRCVECSGLQVIAIENLAAGAKIAEAPNSRREDVDLAAQDARRAFYYGRWTGIMRGERERMIGRLGELVEHNATELARVESENTGKPFKYLSLGTDIPAAVDHLRFFASPVLLL
jgi:betaine-aldehyde dehydrogenase